MTSSADCVGYPDAEPEPVIEKFGLSNSGDVDELATVPEWLIDGLIEKGAPGTLVAPSQALKSFTAQHLGHCVATGTPFCGREIDEQGAVVFVIGEGSSGHYRRVKACLMEHGYTYQRAGERRVGRECRSRWAAGQWKKKLYR